MASWKGTDPSFLSIKPESVYGGEIDVGDELRSVEPGPPTDGEVGEGRDIECDIWHPFMQLE